MRYALITLSYIIIFASGLYIGYDYGLKKGKAREITVYKEKPVTKEIIRYVDRSNRDEVDKALNSGIDISAIYSPVHNNTIFVDIIATNGYVKSSMKDKITFEPETDYKRDLISGGIWLGIGIISGYFLGKSQSVNISLMKGTF